MFSFVSDLVKCETWVSSHKNNKIDLIFSQNGKKDSNKNYTVKTCGCVVVAMIFRSSLTPTPSSPDNYN